MMNVMLLSTSADVASTGAFSPERWALTGQMILIGMGMVFAVLAILWVVLALFKLVFAKPEAKAVEKKTVEPILEQAKPNVPVAPKSDEAELIAIITTAIAAYRASEEPELEPNGFRVVSFRKAHSGRSWNTK